jgi:hypothetical protein
VTNLKKSNVEQGANSSPKCEFLPEDLLESYLLGRLPGQQRGAEDDPEVRCLEEHLLWCEVCQVKAETEEKELAELRAALSICRRASKGRKRVKVKTLSARQ